MITSAAMKAGFGGGMVVDFPNSTRAKKYFLVLTAGARPSPSASASTNVKSSSNAEVEIGERNNRIKRKHGNSSTASISTKNRDWVLKKKELRRKRGFADVPKDTKFTARKRSKKAF